MKRFTIIILAVALTQCGGSDRDFTALKKPVAIALSQVELAYQNVQTKFAYVVDQFTQSLIVVDTTQEKIVDNYPNDDFDFSPVAVGGSPSAVAVDDEAGHRHIFVADEFNKKILAYQIANNYSRSADYISYQTVPLGGATEGISSRALFKDSGSSSTPTLTNIVVDPVKGKNEAWRLKSNGNGSYEVLGTESGIQTKRAIEGQTYRSDGGEIQLFISAGGERTTEDDQFFFSTARTKPHTLVSNPVDLLIQDRKMYILTQNVPSIVVFDLDQLSEEGTFLIPDADARPTHLSIHNDTIFVSNEASGSIFSFSTLTQTFTTIPTSVSAVKFVHANDTNLFLVESSTSKIFITDLTGTGIKSLILNDSGNFFFAATVLGKKLGFVPNISGNVDVIDTTTLKRIDTDLDDKSDFINPEFFDTGATSSPQLISVSGKSNKVMSETWQMIYEGVIPNTSGRSGTILGNVLTSGSATFVTSNVKAGDVINTNGSSQNLRVASVTDETHVVLTTTPAQQGSIVYEIRANNAYLLVGSKSGIQENRVISGEAYTSDNGEISLRVRPSFTEPETQDDFFTFQTLDPIDPIIIGNQSMAVAGVAFARLPDKLPVAYILQQTNGQISIVNLIDLNLQNTL